MNDELGKRMKEYYEDRTRISVPRRTYTIIRLDGKAFHTFTKGYRRPFDKTLMNMMDQTAAALCKQIQGVCMAYVQSDEISLVLTDFTTPKTDAWFDGNIQKMASISASIASVEFNRQLLKNSEVNSSSEFFEEYRFALFDSRVFSIPSITEVFNYLIWRQLDATRNSIQMAAQSLYSQKELNCISSLHLQEMIFQKGINWSKDYTTGEKRGRVVRKEKYEVPVKLSKVGSASELFKPKEEKFLRVTRTRWVVLDGTTAENEIPVFTQDKDFLLSLIPRLD